MEVLYYTAQKMIDLEAWPIEMLPKVIAEHKLDLLYAAAAVSECRAAELAITSDIDVAISADATLTNDGKRKAAKTIATQSNTLLISARESLAQAERMQAELEIALGYYKDELRVAIALLGVAND